MGRLGLREGCFGAVVQMQRTAAGADRLERCNSFMALVVVGSAVGGTRLHVFENNIGSVTDSFDGSNKISILKI